LSLCLLAVSVIFLHYSTADYLDLNEDEEGLDQRDVDDNGAEEADEGGDFDDEDYQERIKRNSNPVSGRRRYNGKQNRWKPPRY